MDPRGSPPWFGAITVNSMFCSNRWPRSSQKFEFCGMVIFYGLTHFLAPTGPIGTKMDPRGSPPWFGAITVNSIFCPNRWPRSSQKFEFWGMVIFYGFDLFFLPQWDPNGTKMDPRGSPPWFGAITVNSKFCPYRWLLNSKKFEFCGMVIFYGFDPFFCSNGTPSAPRCTLGGPHRDLAP